MAVSQENTPPPAPAAGAGGRGGAGGGAPTAAVGGGGRGGAGGGGAGGELPARVPGKLYATDEDFEKDTQPETQAPWPAHGFLAKAKVDQEHWITAGVPPHSVVTNRTTVRPSVEVPDFSI